MRRARPGRRARRVRRERPAGEVPPAGLFCLLRHRSDLAAPAAGLSASQAVVHPWEAACSHCVPKGLRGESLCAPSFCVSRLGGSTAGRSIRNGWVCSGCVLSRDFRCGLLAILVAVPIQLRRLISFGIQSVRRVALSGVFVGVFLFLGCWPSFWWV